MTGRGFCPMCDGSEEARQPKHVLKIQLRVQVYFMIAVRYTLSPKYYPRTKSHVSIVHRRVRGWVAHDQRFGMPGLPDPRDLMTIHTV